ncbi:unnamed protein product [Nippostrongylus brasiliensis]|uniref:Uncharacterized protein n=1 Tax=Nippostrongylus brasiliensis TaxID=27835 RepID=A0A0N4XDC3_NIPBR|nr:hypothetical protein Q1695_011485 [Nippostrongylus brasiliensis]VDL63206.1 unnamed protein product [Nippostrongylus brasiliensis]
MRALRTLLALLLFAIAFSQAFMIDSDDLNMADYPLPKRSFQHIWRNIEMQMPGSQKRTESLSRARANAYYRLG